MVFSWLTSWLANWRSCDPESEPPRLELMEKPCPSDTARAGELWWGAPLAGCVFHTRHLFSTMCEILWPMGLSGKEKKEPYPFVSATGVWRTLSPLGHAEPWCRNVLDIGSRDVCGERVWRLWGCASRKPSWVWHVSPQRESSVSLTITLMLQDTLSFIFLFGIWRPH